MRGLPPWARMGEALICATKDLAPSGGKLLLIDSQGNATPIALPSPSEGLPWPCGGADPLDCLIPGDELLARRPSPEGGRRERWPIEAGSPQEIAGACRSRLREEGAWAEAILRQGRPMALRRGQHDPWEPAYDQAAQEAGGRGASAEGATLRGEGGDRGQPPFPFDLP